MIKPNDIIADMHTHTIFSQHAYSTVKENIEAAKKNKIKYLAITDHFYGNGDDLDRKNEASRIVYCDKRINTVEKDITIIGSAEFNLGQKIDNWNKIKNIKWKPIGLHNWFISTQDLSLEELYNLFKEASNKHNAFAHIEREIHKIAHGKYNDNLTSEVKQFFKEIVILAARKDVFLEVNESSLITNEKGGANRLRFWLEYAKKQQCKICLGTDAHYCMEVGNFSNAIKLLNEMNYPKELILNCNKDLIESIL